MQTISNTEPRRSDITLKIICRVCKENHGEFLALDSKMEADTSVMLIKLFNKCTNLKAKIGDTLPQALCQQCVDYLKSFQEFLDKAWQADKDFKLLLQSNDEHILNMEQHSSIEDESGTDDLPYSVEEEIDAEENEIVPVVEKADYALQQCEINEDKQNHSSKIEQEVCEVEHVEIELLDATPKKNFKCKDCSKSFKTAQKLRQHDLVHTKAKDYMCTVCGKRFANIYRQRNHLKTHTKERNFSCEYCEKSFITNASLKLHLVSHTDVRPFHCKTCGKCFQHRSVLNTHMTLHEGKSSVCYLCDRKFSRPSHLRIHMRLHTGERPYKCSHCECSYMQKSHLDRHVGLHLGIRFTCEQCNKVYTKKSTLDTHIQQEHLRTKVFKCNLCALEFNKRKGYYYHMKKKHPNIEEKHICEN